MALWPWKKKREAAESVKRSYKGASRDSAFSGWNASPLSSDKMIARDLSTLRARARDVAMNSPHARNFLAMVGTNVIGESGISLQVRALRDAGPETQEAARIIENAFWEWGDRRGCDVRGLQSWRDLLRLIVVTVARDGEVILRFVRGREYMHGLSLQVLESDYLDETLNRPAENGRNKIVMGVEVNDFGRPLAYFLRADHPGDTGFIFQGKGYTRVPADEIVHAFVVERPGQSRGVTWMHPVLGKLLMLAGYEEAELISARVGASKFGFYRRGRDSPSYEDAELQQFEENGIDLVPGGFTRLPDGMEIETWDPQHPAGNFQFFVKSILQSIASGLSVSYHGLSGDLEGVSFSSIRSGVLAERDQWKMVQNWLIESVCVPVFEKWLAHAVLSDVIPMGIAETRRSVTTRWVPRRWPWVDPLRDSQASILAVKEGIKSRSQVCAELGSDLEEVWEEVKHEGELQEKLNLSFEGGGKGGAGVSDDANGEGGEQPGGNREDKNNSGVVFQ